MLIAYRSEVCSYLWAQVYELHVYSFIYLQCFCCNENKIMTPVYSSARQTDAGDTQTVARGEYRPNYQAVRLPRYIVINWSLGAAESHHSGRRVPVQVCQLSYRFGLEISTGIIPPGRLSSFFVQLPTFGVGFSPWGLTFEAYVRYF